MCRNRFITTFCAILLAGCFMEQAVASPVHIDLAVVHAMPASSLRQFTALGNQAASIASAAFVPTAIASGGSHTCWLPSGGTVVCWGHGSGGGGNGEATPPTGTFSQIDLGEGHSCGLKSDGSLACWGYNGWSIVTNTPTSGTYIQISAGGYHNCALRSDGTPICWGRDGDNQVTDTPSGTVFTQISAGGYHNCGLKTDSTLACWGADWANQITDMPTGTFTQISAGGYHTCGLKPDGTVICWGAGTTDTGGLIDYGQSIAPAGTFTQLSAGGYHTCGIKTDGTLACWGRNTNGQSTPPPGTFSEVSAGGRHTCGVKTDGSLTCWGSNDVKQSQPYSISGSAGIAGAILSYTDGTVKTATANGSGNYSLNVTYNWSGTVTPALAGYAFAPTNMTYTNVLANQLAQNYTATAATPPVVNSSVRAGANPTSAASVPFTVTFSEPVTGVDATDFSLATTGSISGTAVSGVSGAGTTYTVTVATGSGSGTIHLDVLDDDSIVYASAYPLGGSGAGNGAFTSGETYSVDTMPPTVVSSLRADPTPTNAASVSFTVTFSESVTGVDTTDFSLATTGSISGAAVSSVSGSGTTYTVTVTTGSGSGTIRLDVLDDDSIVDAVANPLSGLGTGNGAFTSGETYTIDSTPPMVVSSLRTDSSFSNATSVSFTVTFSESVTGVDATDFSLVTTGSISGATVSNVSGAAVSNVSGAGATYTVTVTTGSGSGTIGLAVLDDDSIIDAVANPLGGLGAGNGAFTSGEVYTMRLYNIYLPVVIGS